jgi:hypothetical protein
MATKASPFRVVVRGKRRCQDRHGWHSARQAGRYHTWCLQQRDASARRCYQDVLNEKKTREFKGTVKILLSLNTNGTAKRREVHGRDAQQQGRRGLPGSTVKEFEFPKLDRAGDIQYDYKFEPQY